MAEHHPIAISKSLVACATPSQLPPPSTNCNLGPIHVFSSVIHLIIEDTYATIWPPEKLPLLDMSSSMRISSHLLILTLLQSPHTPFRIPRCTRLSYTGFPIPPFPHTLTLHHHLQFRVLLHNQRHRRPIPICHPLPRLPLHAQSPLAV